ncbi:KRI1-like family-domain-containing protein [Chiua virens]|nr:KRI1-like family-domain-containing protein [Chiua virens]
MLSDSDSDENDLHTLAINEHFAKAFEYKKEREELAKLKEKYGSDYSGSDASNADDSEDSEDTEEDSDGEELTPAVDAAILRTLALIRKKDPVIYEGSKQVFEEEHTQTQHKAPSAKQKKKDKSKPLTVREAALAFALADGDPHSRSASPEPRPLTHTEEQALLRSETRDAFRDAVDAEGQGNDDDLLIPRSRTRDEVELEEEEYKTFLEKEVGEDLRNFITVDAIDAIGVADVETVEDGDKKQVGKKKKGKKEREKEKQTNQEKVEMRGKKAQKKGDTKLKEEADQEFLINYIFNRGWIDRSNRRVPTYNEIVASSSKPSKGKSAESQVEPNNGDAASQNSIDENNDDLHGGTLSDDNSFDDLADAFETSYNFRFEEPGGALITSFPRNVSTVRRESTTRKDARTRKKQRQESEKQGLLEARREEIRKERELVEAVVAEEGTTNGDTLMIENDTSKKSRKQQKKEELARMKALKAKELRRKLEMVSSEGGLAGMGDEALSRLDLDADWDPAKHDAQMSELYGGDVDGDDTEKPTWDDDIDINNIDPSTNTKSKAELKKQKKKAKKKNKDEDEDAGVDEDEMDADLDAGTGWDDWADEEEWRGTEAERQRKVDAYMDEVVNRLGFSGITSHIPTRFHYTSTPLETYGLTPAEILLATDTELNSYVGLKKLAPYRIDKDGKAKKNWDPKRAQRLKEFRETLHSRVGSKYEGSWAFNGGINSKALNSEARGEKKRKGKNERAKFKAAQAENDGEGTDGDNASVQPEVAGKPQKRRYDSDEGLQTLVGHPGEAELEGEPGAQKRKRRRRHKKGSGGGGEVDVSATS